MPVTHCFQLAVRGRGTRPFDLGSTLLVSVGGVAQPVKTPVDAVRVGDWVEVTYGGDWPTAPALVPQPSYGPIRGSEKTITIPPVMSEDLASLLGAYLAEGHTIRSNWSVILTNSVIEVLEKAQDAWREVFGLTSRITRQPGRCPGLVVSSKRLVEFMDGLAIGSRAANKAVPHCILGGSREHALAFLQGAALDAYTTTRTASKWAICLESSRAIDGLQDLVTKLGITNAQIAKFNRQMNKTYYELYAAGRAGQELCQLVPFLEPDKADRAEAYVAATIDAGTADVIPGVIGLELYDLVPKGKGSPNGGRGRQRLTHLRDPRTTRARRSSMRRACSRRNPAGLARRVAGFAGQVFAGRRCPPEFTLARAPIVCTCVSSADCAVASPRSWHPQLAPASIRPEGRMILRRGQHHSTWPGQMLGVLG